MSISKSYFICAIGVISGQVSLVFLVVFTVLLISAGLSAQDTSVPLPRLANGIPVEGTVQEATAAGLAVETVKGTKVYPWKYLSAGTRYRYKRLLSQQEKAKKKAEEKAKAKAKAKKKAGKKVVKKAEDNTVKKAVEKAGKKK